MERLERERLEKEELERERIKHERTERKKLKRIEKERLQREKEEQERVEKEMQKRKKEEQIKKQQQEKEEQLNALIDKFDKLKLEYNIVSTSHVVTCIKNSNYIFKGTYYVVLKDCFLCLFPTWEAVRKHKKIDISDIIKIPLSKILSYSIKRIEISPSLSSCNSLLNRGQKNVQLYKSTCVKITDGEIYLGANDLQMLIKIIPEMDLKKQIMEYFNFK